MADKIVFKKGTLANLENVGISNGQLLVTTDEHAIYIDDGGKRIRLGDFVEVATFEELPTLEEKPSSTALYYVTEDNFLAKWDESGQAWKHINEVGIETAEATGQAEASGISLTYEEETRKLTLNVSKALLDEAGVRALIQGDETRLQTLETRVTTLEGGEETSGSVKNTVKASVDAAKTELLGDEETPESILGVKKAVEDEKTRAQSTEQTLTTDVSGLKDTVGDTGKGLVKDVNELKEKINGVTGAMHFKGAASENPATMEDPASQDYVAGDVVTYNDKEFVLDSENKFVELGDVTAEQKQISELKDWKTTADSDISNLKTWKEEVPTTYATKTEVTQLETRLKGESKQGITTDSIGAAADAILTKALAGLEWGDFTAE